MVKKKPLGLNVKQIKTFFEDRTLDRLESHINNWIKGTPKNYEILDIRITSCVHTRFSTNDTKDYIGEIIYDIHDENADD